MKHAKQTYCFFSALFAPSVGGVEQYTDSLTKKLCELGHKCIIVTNNVFDLQSYELLNSDREIYRLPCVSLLNGRLPISKKNHVYKELFTKLKEEKIDQICINTRFYPFCVDAFKFANALGIKPIVIEHGSAYLSLGSPFFDSILKIYEHAITSVIKKYNADYYGVSRASANWLKTFGIHAKGTLNNAINIDDEILKTDNSQFKANLSLKSDDFVVVFVGRMVKEKGIKYLMAAANILKYDPKIKFIFAGTGKLESEIQNLNESNILFLGKLSHKDAISLLKISDVLCMPTRSEGFPTVLLEAAACGTPPIITQVGGVEELVKDESYGVVLNNTDPQTISDAILRLASDRNLVFNMGEKLKELVTKSFSWDAVALRFIEASNSVNLNEGNKNTAM